VEVDAAGLMGETGKSRHNSTMGSALREGRAKGRESPEEALTQPVVRESFLDREHLH
jgi:hypothetical protein